MFISSDLNSTAIQIDRHTFFVLRNVNNLTNTYCGVMSGPMSTPSSNSDPTFNVFASSTKSSIHSLLSATKIATLRAMHLLPAAPKAAPAIAVKIMICINVEEMSRFPSSRNRTNVATSVEVISLSSAATRQPPPVNLWACLLC